MGEICLYFNWLSLNKNPLGSFRVIETGGFNAQENSSNRVCGNGNGYLVGEQKFRICRSLLVVKTITPISRFKTEQKLSIR